MNPIVQQTTSISPGAQTAMPIAWGILLAVPVIMLLSGMIFGFNALRDIRLANGRLGGAMLATIAAGLVPAIIITILTYALVLVMETLWKLPGAQPSRLWSFAGLAGGVFLSFVFLRSLHRRATGWVPPVQLRATVPLSGMGKAAVILTAIGVVLALTNWLRPSARVMHTPEMLEQQLPGTLVVLAAATVCGIFARREKPALICAWISGAFFGSLFLLLA